MGSRLERDFYRRDVLQVAPGLLGKYLIRVFPGGSVRRFVITETEAYRGAEDKACHASKGRTRRTEVMFGDGGHLYMYFVYGMYWMLNVVAAAPGIPQAVLVRGLAETGAGPNSGGPGTAESKGMTDGPGKLTRVLQVNRDYYGEDLVHSDRIWIEESGLSPEFSAGPRIGIGYAGEPWTGKPWRYVLPNGPCPAPETP